MGQLGGQQRQLGAQQQQQQLQRLQAMEQAGARTQQEQQRDYDIAHQDFQRQQGWEQKQVGWQLGAMQGLPYQNTQVIGQYGQEPGLASDVAGAVGAVADYRARTPGQTVPTTPDLSGGLPLSDTSVTPVDYSETNPFLPEPSGYTAPVTDSYSREADYEGEGGGWPSRGGGYLSSSGILAPYHKKLIDGLYAGGRINY